MNSSKNGHLLSGYFPIALLVLLGIMLYANTISGEFLWDDKSYIADSPYIRDLNNIYLLFQPWKFNQLPGDYVDITRPLMFISLLIDYQFWGLDPKGYHITNIALHIIASVLVYYLSLNLEIRRSYSLVGALLFLVHPVHTEAVAGMTFREDLLVTVFFVSSLIFFIKSANKQERQARILNYLLSLLFFVFALFSKEMAVTLPAVAFIYLLSVNKKPLNIKKIFLLFAPFVLITVPYLIWIAGAYSSLSVSPGHDGSGIYIRLNNIPSVIFYYLKIFLFPLNLSADPGYALKTSFFHPYVWLPFVLLLVILIYAVWGLKKRSAYSFSIFFFLITLLPVLQIFPTFNLVAERFLYLPSVGASLFTALLISECINEKRKILLLTTIMLSFSLVTIERNFVWNNGLTLWTDALKKNNNSFFAHINISNYYFEKKNYAKAEKGFREIIKRWPGQPEAYNNLAIIYIENSLYSDAEKILKKAISMRVDTPEIHMNLAVALNALKRYDEAIVAAKRALKRGVWLSGGNRFLADAYVGLGKKKFDKEDYAGALDAFGQAIDYGYEGFNIHVYLARAYYGNGNYEKSIEEFKKVLSVNRNDGTAYFFLAESFRKTGRYREALESYHNYLARWKNHEYSDDAKKMIERLEETL